MYSCAETLHNLVYVILQAIWYAFPAIMANQLPIFATYYNILPSLAKPIDGGRIYKDGKPLFGKNKTIRGFIVAVAGAIIVALIQGVINKSIPAFREISLIDFSGVKLIIFGFLSGVGAMTGDLIKSFFKRRKNFEPGELWFPFDQSDAAIGFIIFTYPLYQPPPEIIIALILSAIPLHMLSNLTGFYLGFKENRF